MNDEPKFTPGPWRLRHKSYCRIETCDGVPVAQTLLQEPQPYSPWGIMRGGIDATNPVRRANALLIVSAPDMYKELDDICMMCQHGEITATDKSCRFGECRNCSVGKLLNRIDG